MTHVTLLTRYEAIVQAVLEELDRQKSVISGEPHLRSVQVIVELARGNATVSVSIKAARPRYPIPTLDARNFVPEQP